jgi:class 3 adenylate cyclase/YHS domain-containing protein
MEVDRTFAFVDLCAFTAYTETHGSTAATQVLAGFRSASREISSRRGVRIAKWLGDGCMIVGVEPQPVLEAIIEIEHRTLTSPSQLALRFGVTYGKAILFEGDDYIGSVVNLSKRLCDAAAPHEILIGPGVDQFLPPWADATESGELLIKGFDGSLPRERLALREMEHPVLDPVCLLSIDPEYAYASTADRDGNPVVFCSEPCQITWQSASSGQPLF